MFKRKEHNESVSKYEYNTNSNTMQWVSELGSDNLYDVSNEIVDAKFKKEKKTSVMKVPKIKNMALVTKDVVNSDNLNGK